MTIIPEFNMHTPPIPDTEIWIADNVCITCKANFNEIQIFFLKLLLGWKIKKIEED